MRLRTLRLRTPRAELGQQRHLGDLLRLQVLPDDAGGALAGAGAIDALRRHHQVDPEVVLGLGQLLVQDLPLGEAQEIEARNFARTSLSEDAVTGVAAFLQKTEPEFKGR